MLTTLESLDLSVNPIGDRGVNHLHSVAFSRLTELSLANCNVTDRGIAALAASGALDGLGELSLAWNSFSDAGVKVLAHCGGLIKLRSLDLSGIHFGVAGAVALLESPYIINLRHLTLGQNHRLPEEMASSLRARFS
jgi:hypothetical protein